MSNVSDLSEQEQEAIIDDAKAKPPRSEIKVWDYVKGAGVEGLVHIVDDDIVHLYPTTPDQLELKRVKSKSRYAKDLSIVPKPKLGWNYIRAKNIRPVHWSSFGEAFVGEHHVSLYTYPHEGCQDAIRWKAYEYMAQAMNISIQRLHISTDHYHYWIPELGVFCDENYS